MMGRRLHRFAGRLALARRRTIELPITRGVAVRSMAFCRKRWLRAIENAEGSVPIDGGGSGK